ncbi:hypothetical protein [Rubritalea tangerina]|uniref:hypothetical protein n=1 Tax=Rubritalea tangerina TaxID=430798 RepID=UPI003608EEAB
MRDDFVTGKAVSEESRSRGMTTLPTQHCAKSSSKHEIGIHSSVISHLIVFLFTPQ